MRDFFINSFEKLVNVIVVLLAIGVVVFAGMVGLFGGMGPGGASGPLAALGILIGGGIYVVLVGGVMYIWVGIYQNTKRTADAMEKFAAK